MTDYHKRKNPIKRLYVAELITREYRVNGRPLTTLSGSLLWYFALHCGPDLPSGWQRSERQLASQFVKSRETISRAISPLLSEELIQSSPSGSSAAFYTLGPAFWRYFSCDDNITTNDAVDVAKTSQQSRQKRHNKQAGTSNEKDSEKDRDSYTRSGRARVSENQKITLGRMLRERGIEWVEVQANWALLVPGLSAEPPAALADLPRVDFQPLYDWLKDGAGLTVEKPLPDLDGKSREELALQFEDALGGRFQAELEIDRALNHKGMSKAVSIPQYVENWLKRAALWLLEEEHEEDRGKRERSSDERFGRDSSGHQGAGGSWGDTLAARLTRERIQNLPDMFGSGIDPERPES